MRWTDTREVVRRLVKYRKRLAKKQALKCKRDSYAAVNEMFGRRKS